MLSLPLPPWIELGTTEPVNSSVSTCSTEYGITGSDIEDNIIRAVEADVIGTRTTLNSGGGMLAEPAVKL